MLKNILITLMITGLFCYTSAQLGNLYTTARVDALGGTALINDLTYSTFNPGKVFSFADQISITGYTAGWIAGQFGPTFINKSIGKHVVLGVNLCTDFYLKDPYYGYATYQSGTSDYMKEFPWLPKLSLAMKFGEHVFGIGGFCDYSRYSYLKEDSFTPVTGGKDNYEATEDIDEQDHLIISPGVTLSAVLKLGPVYIEPLGGIAFANSYFEKKVSDITKYYTFNTVVGNDSIYSLDSTITEVKTDSVTNKSGLFYNAGVCVFGDISNVWCILGSWYKHEEFQLHRTELLQIDTTYPNGTTKDQQIISPETPYKKLKHQNLSWLAGVVPNIAEKLFLGIQYDGGWSKQEHLVDRSDSMNLINVNEWDTTYEEWSHNARFSIEREFEGKRFLDKIYPRGGLKYNLSRRHESAYFEVHDTINGTVQTEYIEWNRILESSKVTLTGGVGIVKGPLQIDFCFDILNYETGALIGPGMYSLTAILNFGNLKKPPKEDVPEQVDAPQAEVETSPPVTAQEPEEVQVEEVEESEEDTSEEETSEEETEAKSSEEPSEKPSEKQQKSPEEGSETGDAEE